MSSPPFPPPAEALDDGVVALREWRQEDVPALVEALQDPEIPRWTRIPSPYTEEDARRFLAGEAIDETSFAIVSSDQGELVGGLGVRAAGPGAASVGYWVAAPARGRGVVPRALELVAGWALSELGLRRLEVLTRPENRSSQRAAQKAGFRPVGLRPGGIELPGGAVDAVVLVRD